MPDVLLGQFFSVLYLCTLNCFVISLKIQAYRQLESSSVKNLKPLWEFKERIRKGHKRYNKRIRRQSLLRKNVKYFEQTGVTSDNMEMHCWGIRSVIQTIWKERLPQKLWQLFSLLLQEFAWILFCTDIIISH